MCFLQMFHSSPNLVFLLIVWVVSTCFFICLLFFLSKFLIKTIFSHSKKRRCRQLEHTTQLVNTLNYRPKCQKVWIPAHIGVSYPWKMQKFRASSSWLTPLPIVYGLHERKHLNGPWPQAAFMTFLHSLYWATLSEERRTSIQASSLPLS